MNKDKMHKGCKKNEKMKLNRKTKKKSLKKCYKA